MHDLDDLLLDQLFRPMLRAAQAMASAAALARGCLIAVLMLQTAVLAWDLRVLTDPVALSLVAGVTLAEFIVAGLLQAEIDLAEEVSGRGALSAARLRLRPFRLIAMLMLTVATGVWLRSDFHLADFCSLGAIVLWFCALFLVSADPGPAVLTLPEFRISMPRRPGLSVAPAFSTVAIDRRRSPR